VTAATRIRPWTWVYTVDTSWADYGNRSGTRYHVPDPDDAAKAVCGLHMLDPLMGMPASEVPDHMRCRRAACRNRWAPATTGDDQP
jgi:hypothetical protein